MINSWLKEYELILLIILLNLKFNAYNCSNFQIKMLFQNKENNFSNS